MKSPQNTASPKVALPASVRPWVRCSCCDGTGEARLSNHLWMALKVLASFERPASAAEVYKRLRRPEIGVTAVNNRLVALVDLGLAEFVGKDGRQKLYLGRDGSTPIKP